MNSLRAAVLTLCFFPFVAHAIDDTVTIVNGYTTNIGTFITTGTNNFLMITNGGVAMITNIAAGPTARSNVVIVTGNGSMISNTAPLSIRGMSNAVQFIANGQLHGGLAPAGTNNFVLLQDNVLNEAFTVAGLSNRVVFAGSTLNTPPTSDPSIAGNSNLVQFEDGAVWNSTFLTYDQASRSNLLAVIGGSHQGVSFLIMSGNGNMVLLSGPGSTWNNTNYAAIDASSLLLPGNSMRVVDSARADFGNSLNIGVASHFNTFEALTNSVVNIQGFLNVGGGDSNSVSIDHFSRVTSDGALIGTEQGIGNGVSVRGEGASWTNRGSLDLKGRSNSWLRVTDGARVVSGSFSSNGRSNLITVGTGSSLTVPSDFKTALQTRVDGGGLISSGALIATGGAGHQLDITGGTRWNVKTNVYAPTNSGLVIISDGAILATERLDLGSVSSGVTTGTNNVIRVTGAGSELRPGFISSTRSQELSVEDGALLWSTNFYVSGDFKLKVTNPNSTWIHRGNVETSEADAVLGPGGTKDSFEVSAGGLVTNFNTTIGRNLTNGTFQPSGIPTMSSAVIAGAGSKWHTASNVIVGYNVNSNLVAVMNGGELTARNLSVGVFEWPSRTTSGKIGSENWLRVDGAGSRVTVSEKLLFGHRSVNNRFTISNGAQVSAASMSANIVAQGDTISNSTNVLEILGADSALTINGYFEYSGGNPSFVIDGGGRLKAQSARIAGYTTILGTNSSAEISAALEFTGRNLLVQDSQLTAGSLRLGWIFDPTDVRITGRSTQVGAGEIRIKEIDPLQPQGAGITTVEILDSASVTSRWISIGKNATSGPPIVRVNGGFVYARTPERAGLLEIENGKMEIQAGLVRADVLALTKTNANIAASGAFALADGSAGGDGDLRIGDTTGEAHLKGAIIAGTARLGNGAILKAVATDPALPALVTANSITIDGTLVVSLAHDHKLHSGNGVTLFSAPTITGAFDNIAFGERISTPDGSGSFLLIQQNGKIMLADFQTDMRVNATFDVAGSSMSLSFPTALHPRIETSTNLLEWLEVPTPILGVSGDQSIWTTPIVKEEPQRFYRLAR